MISDERRHRRDYNEYRNEGRDRNRPGDMNYDDAADEQGYDREYDRSTGYNRSRDYGNHIYERRNLPDSGRYSIQDYDYNRGNEGTYGREPGSNEDFRSNRYEQERDYRRAPEAAPGYHGANYENPENSDSSYSRNRNRHENSRQFQAQRNKWDSNMANNMNPYNVGMERYQARDRSGSFYVGRTEYHESRNFNPEHGEDRRFLNRTGDRVRSGFSNEDKRNRDRTVSRKVCK